MEHEWNMMQFHIFSSYGGGGGYTPCRSAQLFSVVHSHKKLGGGIGGEEIFVFKIRVLTACSPALGVKKKKNW